MNYRTWPHEVRPAPRWQVGVSLVLTILLGRSCLAEGGEEAVRRDRSGSLGHLFLGLRDTQGGKWFSSFQTIKARYVPGHQDFELQDPSVPGTIRLSYVRPVHFEGSRRSGTEMEGRTYWQ